MKNTCICTIIKNEHRYLNEWIEHMLNSGFDDIFIYEDFYSEPHNKITDKYENVHLNKLSSIKDINIIKNQKQSSVYNWFIRKYHNEYKWCLFCDIDEFIMFKEGYDLLRLIDENDKEPGILLSWKTFGANNHIERPKTGTLMENYTVQTPMNKVALEREGFLYKSFVNMSRIPNVNDDKYLFSAYHHYFPGSISLGKFAIYNIETDPNNNFSKCWLNHYYTKSWEDWVEKIRKGEIYENNVDRTLDTFFEVNPSMIGYEKFLIYGLYNDYIANNFKDGTLLSKKYGLKVNLPKDKKTKVEKVIKKNYNNAVLYLCNHLTEELIGRYLQIKKDIESNNSNYKVYLTYDTSNDNSTALVKRLYDAYEENTLDDIKKSDFYEKLNIYEFNVEELRHMYGMCFYSTNDPFEYGLFNTNLVVQKFMKDHNYEFDYCWLIEYDVILNNKPWNDLIWDFDTNSNSDFISSHVRKLSVEWFNTLIRRTAYKGSNYKLQSFNPIYRLSSKAVKVLNDWYMNPSNNGFYEITIVNIINDNDMSIEDFGGTGEYVKKENIEKWYIQGIGINCGSIHYNAWPKDMINTNQSKIFDGKLIHPIKFQ